MTTGPAGRVDARPPGIHRPGFGAAKVLASL